MTELSIVIPSWNTRELLRACLASVRAADKPETEVIVVDNASADGSADLVAAEFPEVVLQRNDRNEGFARGCNQGIALSRGRYVLLLNADTEVHAGAIPLMVGWLEEHPEYGASAPRLVHPDGRTQRACQAFPSWWTPLFFATPLERWLPESRELRRYFLRDWDHEDDRDVDQPPAACLCIRRAVLDEVGTFDEELWLFYNDVDLSRRMAAAGYCTRFRSEARVLHHVGASTSQYGEFLTEWQKNRLAYYRKHHGFLAGPWLKLCVSFAFADYLVGNAVRKLRGRGGDPLGQLVRSYGRFLLQ